MAVCGVCEVHMRMCAYMRVCVHMCGRMCTLHPTMLHGAMQENNCREYNA